MAVPSVEELDSFKYSDLQNLAKSLGLRANLRADKLLKALKAHLKQARKESKNQDESQTSAPSCDESVVQITDQEQAKREPVGRVTKARKRRKTVHADPDSQDHSEVKISEATEFQNQAEQGNQDLRTANVLLPRQSQDDNALASEKRETNDSEDSKGPSERKSLHTDGLSRLGTNKRTALTTPNFKKLHEARFKEMESIDEYIKRKKKHFEDHNSSNELKKQPCNKEGAVTPGFLRGGLSVVCTPTSRRHSRGRSHGPGSQSIARPRESGRRGVLSATKMNVRFSAATKDNEHKQSLTKTPARKSPHVTAFGSASKGQAVLGTPKLKITKGDSAAVITPFKLAGLTTQTPVSSKKPVFDLKASLSRPLNYEPHKGKLKPWGQSKENNSLNEHGNRVSFHKKTYKQPRLQTKEEQRKKREQERKEKKAKVLEARRGLITVKS